MTLEELMDKFEKYLASLDLKELYLFRGLIVEPRGKDMILEKIDRLIVYRENGPKSTADFVGGSFDETA